MSVIFVNEGDEVTTGQVIGEAGNVADNVFCSSNGPHLHFGVRLYFGPGTWDSLDTNIDPFGWWTGGEDPWETYSGGYESRWLWWGDEAGDGHYTVDDTESQAQLFYPFNWWYDENGYNGGAWWTYEVGSEEASTNWAIWGTYIETPGTYVIQAYWPASEEATRLAWYRIYTEQDGWIGSAWVDQAAHGGEWYTLGTYDLPQGPVAVILTDWGDGALERARRQVTEDSSSPRVYFDAVRWATPTPQATPTPIPTPTPTPTPPPTRTPTPVPTPTPTPRWGWWEAAEEAALQEKPPQERAAYSRLLSRVRDEVMASDPTQRGGLHPADVSLCARTDGVTSPGPGAAAGDGAGAGRSATGAGRDAGAAGTESVAGECGMGEAGTRGAEPDRAPGESGVAWRDSLVAGVAAPLCREDGLGSLADAAPAFYGGMACRPVAGGDGAAGAITDGRSGVRAVIESGAG